jgi:anaerobic magnesium-protoporphyrin IX monomethyl ester cyclase
MNTRGSVLLVNPAITSADRARFPLSLLALAAVLEQRHDVTIVDGNVEEDVVALVLRLLVQRRFDAVGITVMGGPQLRTAMELSLAIRARGASPPIVWGGYFPSLYPDVTMSARYVDYVVRGQGERGMLALLDALVAGDTATLAGIPGLSFRSGGEVIAHAAAPFEPRFGVAPLPYDKLGDPRRYLVRTFMGARTAAHQAAVGCRFRCTFCGVAGMFNGATALPPAQRLDHELAYLKNVIGADSIQYYDHNFLDREADMVPLLEVMAKHRLPWWCYARADALLNLSAPSWKLVRESGLRMAYIGAETSNDRLLKSIRKGTKAEQTLEVAELCRRQGVIPELSFMVAPPEDPEGETERTFEFIRRVKRVNPDAEIIVYVYTPLPPSRVPNAGRLNIAPLRGLDGAEVSFPQSLEEWAEPRWIDYACHADAPWVSERLRRRIRDFVTVLNCRFPTVQDPRSLRISRTLLRGLAGWRYRFRRYDRPWELHASRNFIELLDPRVSSI